MNPGTLDRLATIEYPVRSINAETSAETVTWLPLMPLPGSPVVGERVRGQLLDQLPSRSEAVRTGLPVARNQSRWRMRWVDGVTTDMRLTVHGDSDVVYQIVAGPAMMGRKVMLELVLERWAA